MRTLESGLQGLLRLALITLLALLSLPAKAQDYTQVGAWVSDELRLSMVQRIALPPGQWRVAAFYERALPVFNEQGVPLIGELSPGLTSRNLTLVNASREAALMLLMLSWTEGQTGARWSDDACERPSPGGWAIKERLASDASGLLRKCVLTDVFHGSFREQVLAYATGSHPVLSQSFAGLGASIRDFPRNAVQSSGWLQREAGDRISWTVFANPELSGFTAPRDLSSLQADERQQGVRHWMQALHQWQIRYLDHMERRFWQGLSFLKAPPVLDFMPSAMVSPAPALRMDAQGLPQVNSLGSGVRLEGLAFLTDSAHHGLMTVRSHAADELLLEDSEGFVWHWLSGFYGVSASMRNRAETRRLAARLASLRPLQEGKSLELEPAPAPAAGGAPRWRHRVRVLRAHEAHATPLGPRKVFELEHLERALDAPGQEFRTVYLIDAELFIPWSTQVRSSGDSTLIGAHRESFTIRSIHATPAFPRSQAGVVLEGSAVQAWATPGGAPSTSAASPAATQVASLSRVSEVAPAGATSSTPAPMGAPAHSPAASPAVSPAASPATRGRLNAHALVIGNAAYPGVARLANPVNDARAIGKKLEQFGFRVTLIEDASRERLLKSLVEFKRTAAGSDLSLLFYAGHGAQIDGSNYMVPLDVVSDDPEEVKIQAMNVGQVVDGFMPGRTRLVLLDACRNNPFLQVGSRGTQSGLAPMNVASGTLIAFATKGGSTAEDGLGAPHSPFTAALLEHLGEASDISLMLRRVRSTVMRATQGKQQPWEYGSLVGDELVLSRLAQP